MKKNKKTKLNNIMMSNRQKEVFGLSFIIISIAMFICILFYFPKEDHRFGIIGQWMSETPYNLLGYSSILIPLLMLIIGYILFTKKIFSSYSVLIKKIIISFLWISTFTDYLYDSFNISVSYPDSFLARFAYPGILGSINYNIINYVFMGEIILCISFVFIITWIFNISNYELVTKSYKYIKGKLFKIFEKFTGFFKKNKTKIDSNTPIINSENEYDSIIEENDINNSDDKSNLLNNGNSPLSDANNDTESIELESAFLLK